MSDSYQRDMQLRERVERLEQALKAILAAELEGKRADQRSISEVERIAREALASKPSNSPKEDKWQSHPSSTGTRTPESDGSRAPRSSSRVPEPQREPDYSAAGTFEALRSEIARDPSRPSMMLSAPSAQVLVDEYDRLEEQLQAAHAENERLRESYGHNFSSARKLSELREQFDSVREDCRIAFGHWPVDPACPLCGSGSAAHYCPPREAARDRLRDLGAASSPATSSEPGVLGHSATADHRLASGSGASAPAKRPHS